jgi:HEAT repeat protein
MAQKVKFKTVLDALLEDGSPFPGSYLKEFSDISPLNLDALLKVWPDVSPKRKQNLLEDLEDLADIDTLTSFEDMARALLNDNDPHVRVQSIRLLKESEDKKLVPIFLKFVQQDDSAEVRAAAAGLLGWFIYLGELEKIPPDYLRQIEDVLLKKVESKDDKPVRQRALESLGYSSCEEVIPLIQSAYEDDDPDWVVSSIFAMGRSNDDRWKKEVLSQLYAADEDIRLEAIRASGNLELSAARASLLDQLNDEEDLDIRRDIIWSLSKIGGEGVRDRLDELFEMEDDDEEAEYIEEAMENLNFTEGAQFSLFDIDADEDNNGLQEEDLDLDEDDDD